MFSTPAPVAACLLPQAALPVMLLWALAVFCTFTHLERIASRGGKDTLATIAGSARWALPSAMLLLTGVGAAIVGVGDYRASAVTFCGLILGVPAFVFGYGLALAALAKFVVACSRSLRSID
jgi:hypothetical protein